MVEMDGLRTEVKDSKVMIRLLTQTVMEMQSAQRGMIASMNGMRAQLADFIEGRCGLLTGDTSATTTSSPLAPGPAMWPHHPQSGVLFAGPAPFPSLPNNDKPQIHQAPTELASFSPLFQQAPPFGPSPLVSPSRQSPPCPEPAIGRSPRGDMVEEGQASLNASGNTNEARGCPASPDVRLDAATALVDIPFPPANHEIPDAVPPSAIQIIMQPSQIGTTPPVSPSFLQPPRRPSPFIDSTSPPYTPPINNMQLSVLPTVPDDRMDHSLIPPISTLSRDELPVFVSRPSISAFHSTVKIRTMADIMEELENGRVCGDGIGENNNAVGGNMNVD